MADTSLNGLGGINMSKLIVRANRISVVIEEGVMVATFYRTHKKLGRVDQFEAEYDMVDGVNSVAQKELFRQHIINNAMDLGYDYDPQDRRTDSNKVPSKYPTEELLGDTAVAMVTPDIQEWADKMGDMVKSITCDYIEPVTMSNNGKDVRPKYNNGNWAWATITVSATIMSHGEEIYVDMNCSLVSGQMKKPTKISDGGYNYTGFKAEVERQLTELGIQLVEEDKSHKEKAKDTPVEANEEAKEIIEEPTIQYPDWVRINKDGTPNKRDIKKWEAMQNK